MSKGLGKERERIGCGGSMGIVLGVLFKHDVRIKYLVFNAA